MTFKRILHCLTYIAFLSASQTVQAEQPAGSVYLDGGTSKIALILAHGRGKHPTWKVVEPLRKAVQDRLGYHTLSLQMPNDDKNWRDYADDFPRAYTVIRQAISYLRSEHQVEHIYLMGHSMGARMMSAFVAENPDQQLAGLIVAGCRNNGGHPLDCQQSLSDIQIPVLDIWGDDSYKDTIAGSERTKLIAEQYLQIAIPDADHRFAGAEDRFVLEVLKWLKRQSRM